MNRSRLGLVLGILLALLIWVSLAPVSPSHTPSHKPNGFHSPPIPFGTSWNLTLNEPGIYYYHCHPHPWMEATLVVKNSAESSGAYTLRIFNYQFDPNHVEVRPGTQLVWVNDDNDTHYVVESLPPPGSPSVLPAEGEGKLPLPVVWPLAAVGIVLALYGWRLRPFKK